MQFGLLGTRETNLGQYDMYQPIKVVLKKKMERFKSLLGTFRVGNWLIFLLGSIPVECEKEATLGRPIGLIVFSSFKCTNINKGF